MVGFHATADSGQPVHVNDGELEHARWFTREELMQGPPLLPPSQSISYRLITTWLRHPERRDRRSGPLAMCLLVLAWRAHPRYRLVLAANRDEYHERAAEPLAPWPAPNDILAGRDVRAGGTWLGLNRARRFGIVTNFRELQRPRRSAPSRGKLIPDYLASGGGPEAYLSRLETDAPGYSGFNLVVGDLEHLWYASNRLDRFSQSLQPGVHGLSNEFLDSPWPKLLRVRQNFETWLAGESAAAPDRRRRHRVAGHARRPHPGARRVRLHRALAPEWERTLSSPFVTHPTYGTRCSTVLLIEPSGATVMVERRFSANGAPSGDSEYLLNADEWP